MTACGIAVGALAVCALAAPMAGADVFGANMSDSYNGGVSPSSGTSTYVQCVRAGCMAPTGSSFLAPYDGTLTAWTAKGVGTLRLRLLRPHSDGSYTYDGTAPSVSGFTAGVAKRTVLTTPLALHQGDTLGLEPNTAVTDFAGVHNEIGTQLDCLAPAVSDAMSASNNNMCGGLGHTNEVLVQAEITPSVAAPSPTGQRGAALAKCKHKHGKKRKKCKKRANKLPV